MTTNGGVSLSKATAVALLTALVGSIGGGAAWQKYSGHGAEDDQRFSTLHNEIMAVRGEMGTHASMSDLSRLDVRIGYMDEHGTRVVQLLSARIDGLQNQIAETCKRMDGLAEKVDALRVETARITETLRRNEPRSRADTGPVLAKGGKS